MISPSVHKFVVWCDLHKGWESHDIKVDQMGRFWHKGVSSIGRDHTVMRSTGLIDISKRNELFQGHMVEYIDARGNTHINEIVWLDYVNQYGWYVQGIKDRRVRMALNRQLIWNHKIRIVGHRLTHKRMYTIVRGEE